MVKIVDLYKLFGDLEVLSGICLEIPDGKIYGLAGKSGAGKSTLLRCINGLTPYQKGRLEVGGVEISGLSPRAMRAQRQKIGMVFQQFSLLERLSVFENVALPLRCWRYSSREVTRKVRSLLELVGIPEKEQSYPQELSGGQKQRVAIARALCMDPPLLLCDEATSALDPNTAGAILSLLDRINRELGITIVFVTHQMFVLKQICDNVSILAGGRIVEEGSISDLYRRNSQALGNLMEAQHFSPPEHTLVLRLVYDEQQMKQPFLLNLSREVGCDFIILDAEKEFHIRKPLGHATIQVSDRDAPAIQAYLDRAGIAWSELEAGGRGEG